MAIFITKLGTKNKQGLDNALASCLENVLFVTGSGAVRLNGPEQFSLLSRNSIALTMSSRWIHDKY